MIICKERSKSETADFVRPGVKETEDIHAYRRASLEVLDRLTHNSLAISYDLQYTWQFFMLVVGKFLHAYKLCIFGINADH